MDETKDSAIKFEVNLVKEFINKSFKSRITEKEQAIKKTFNEQPVDLGKNVKDQVSAKK